MSNNDKIMMGFQFIYQICLLGLVLVFEVAACSSGTTIPPTTIPPDKISNTTTVQLSPSTTTNLTVTTVKNPVTTTVKNNVTTTVNNTVTTTVKDTVTTTSEATNKPTTKVTANSTTTLLPEVTTKSPTISISTTTEAEVRFFLKHKIKIIYTRKLLEKG